MPKDASVGDLDEDDPAAARINSGSGKSAPAGVLGEHGGETLLLLALFRW